MKSYYKKDAKYFTNNFYVVYMLSNILNIIG